MQERDLEINYCSCNGEFSRLTFKSGLKTVEWRSLGDRRSSESTRSELSLQIPLPDLFLAFVKGAGWGAPSRG